MDKFDRIFQLHLLLRTRRRPVPIDVIAKKLSCSERTAHRIITLLRDQLGAPVAYDHQHAGYHYPTNAQSLYELPGLWFSPQELYALLVSHRLLSDVQPGLLDSHLSPLRKRIEQILSHHHAGSPEISQRVRILSMAGRNTNLEHFRTVVDALLQRRGLRILYHGRERDQLTERVISPQRLVFYRSNWYLDAWCHLRKDLRSFALDRLHPVALLKQPAKTIADAELDKHFASGYGIFAGAPTATAVLRFSSDAARWVADETWHPQQQGRVLASGGYELRIPYSNPRELIGDILRYGDDVEVLEPPALRAAVKTKLENALKRY